MTDNADPRPPSGDPLAAEIAAHRPCRSVRFVGGQPIHQRRCVKCGEPWPCLVRRLADREAALLVRLATLADWMISSGGWRAFYYATDPPPEGIFDLTDIINPDLVPELERLLPADEDATDE
jgi:hypothetical protein